MKTGMPTAIHSLSNWISGPDYMKTQKGLSLIELLIAVALAVTIIAGIVQVFLSNRQAFNLSESMIRVQESGRFAVRYISEVVRDTGSYGCVPTIDTESGNVQSRIAGVTDLNPIQTVASATAPVWDASADGDAVAGDFDDPDVISMLQLENDETRIEDALTVQTLEVTDASDFDAGDYILVTNCLVADFAEVDSVSGDEVTVDTLNLRKTLYDQINKRSAITHIRHVSFSVDAEENLIISVNGVDQEVVSGIENIQFQYGVDLGTADSRDNVPDYFADIEDIPADEVDNIVAVNISVLAVSGTADDGDAENVTTDGQTITFNEQTMVMDDQRYRSVFQSTVVLRNEVGGI